MICWDQPSNSFSFLEQLGMILLPKRSDAQLQLSPGRVDLQVHQGPFGLCIIGSEEESYWKWTSEAKCARDYESCWENSRDYEILIFLCVDSSSASNLASLYRIWAFCCCSVSSLKALKPSSKESSFCSSRAKPGGCPSSVSVCSVCLVYETKPSMAATRLKVTFSALRPKSAIAEYFHFRMDWYDWCSISS